MSSIPLTTLQANVDYGYAIAFTTYGTIGIKCWIYRGMYGEEVLETDVRPGGPQRHLPWVAARPPQDPSRGALGDAERAAPVGPEFPEVVSKRAVGIDTRAPEEAHV